MSDQTHWEAKLIEAKTGQLDTVRKSAAGWSALFTSLLGVFGVVTFAGGLKEIDDLAPGLTWLVKTGTSLAAIALSVATFFAAKASGLFTTTTNNTTWQNQRDTTINAATEARSDLLRSKLAGVAALLLVLGGSLVAIWGPSAKSPPLTVIVDTNLGVACGPLSKDASGAILVDGEKLTSAALTVVGKCPSTTKV